MRNITFFAEKTVQITEAEFALICDLYHIDANSSAVLFVKAQHSLPIKEAKDLCDAVFEASVLPRF